MENGDQLSDKKRCGRPPLYKEDTHLKTIAFYCQISPLPGCNTWSFRWAEDYLHNEILSCSISRSTIQRTLKRHALRPHLHKYFLTITDPDFFPKMDHITGVYLNPPKYLFNFDECTGLQAKAPLTPDLPADAGTRRYGNGTTDHMAFLNPKTGEVFAKCTPNHNTHRAELNSGLWERGKPWKIVIITQRVSLGSRQANPDRSKASHWACSGTEVRSLRGGVRSRGEARAQAA